MVVFGGANHEEPPSVSLCLGTVEKKKYPAPPPATSPWPRRLMGTTCGSQPSMSEDGDEAQGVGAIEGNKNREPGERGPAAGLGREARVTTALRRRRGGPWTSRRDLRERGRVKWSGRRKVVAAASYPNDLILQRRRLLRGSPARPWPWPATCPWPSRRQVMRTSSLAWIHHILRC